MDDLEARVIAFVAEQCGAKGVTAGSRLAEDLGLDGDDAVEFFEAFAARFPADLTPLYSQWSTHFGPEGWPVWPGIRMVATLLGLFGVSLGMVYFGGHPGWVWAGSAVAMGLLVWGRWRRGPKGAPITVGELVEAARTGRWAVDLP